MNPIKRQSEIAARSSKVEISSLVMTNENRGTTWEERCEDLKLLRCLIRPSLRHEKHRSFPFSRLDLLNRTDPGEAVRNVEYMLSSLYSHAKSAKQKGWIQECRFFFGCSGVTFMVPPASVVPATESRDIVRYLRNWSVSLLEGSRTSDFPFCRAPEWSAELAWLIQIFSQN